MEQHDEKEDGVSRQHAKVPDLVISKIWREGIGLSEREDQGAHSVEQASSHQEQDRVQPEAVVDRSDQEDDDPSHQKKADVGHQHVDLCEENGFQGDEKNGEAPDDPEQYPAGCAVENGQAEGGVRSGDEDVNGVVVENAEDAQIFVEYQKKMQKTAEQEGEKQADAIDGESHHVDGFSGNGRERDQHRQRGNGEDRADEVADGVEVFIGIWGGDERVERWFLMRHSG